MRARRRLAAAHHRRALVDAPDDHDRANNGSV
jgi:hypothetical protein